MYVAAEISATAEMSATHEMSATAEMSATHEMSTRSSLESHKEVILFCSKSGNMDDGSRAGELVPFVLGHLLLLLTNDVLDDVNFHLLIQI